VNDPPAPESPQPGSGADRIDDRALCRAMMRVGHGIEPGAFDGERPDNVLPWQTGRIAAAFDRARVQVRRLTGAHPTERIMLLVLWDEGPATVGELAQTLDITKSAVSQMVDKLVADGRLLRQRDPDDRRRTIVSLAPSVFERALPLWFMTGRAVARRLADELSEDEAAVVLRGFELAHRALIEAAEELAVLSDEQLADLAGTLGRECARHMGRP
jgi:DNA-binding MarR family transcriptional regulator